MAKLLAMIEIPVLSWYPKWIELDESQQPKSWIKNGMIQLPAIKIQLLTHNGHEMSCKVTPDKVLCGPTYTLAYTILDLKIKLLMHWEKDNSWDKNYINKKFDLFHSCLRGVAATQCDLCAAKDKGDRYTEKGFTNSVKDYGHCPVYQPQPSSHLFDLP